MLPSPSPHRSRPLHGFFNRATLRHMRERPGLYILHRPMLESLCDFIQGYKSGLFHCGPGHPTLLLLEGFHTWLAQKHRIPLPPFGWYQIIADQESDDLKRIHLFVDYFLLYLDETENGRLLPTHSLETE